MKKHLCILLCCGFVCLMATLAFADAVKTPMKSLNDKGEIEEIGFVTFTETPDGLLMEVDVIDLPVGTYSASLHQKPDCGPAQVNGKPVAGMAADKAVPLPKGCEPAAFSVDKGGKGKAQQALPGMKMSDVKGHAVIIHSHPQAGSEGGANSQRLACGVVK